MMLRRLAAGVVAIVTLLAVALPAAGSAQGRDPVVGRAIAALGERASYQIDLELHTPYFGDEPVTVRRLVINQPELRYRDLAIVEEEIAVDTITTTDGRWTSVLGTPWQAEDFDGMGAIAVQATSPALRRLRHLAEQGLVLGEVGRELVGEQHVIHYSGEVPPESGSIGSVDVWVDASDGSLVKAITDLRLADEAVEPGVVPTMPVHEVTTVSRVDDPTIVVALPDLAATPAPVAAGDPSLATTVHDAFGALAGLRSYVATKEERTMGYASTVETRVSNGEQPVVRATYLIGDTMTMQVMAMPGSIQARDGVDGEWGPADPERISCDGVPCDAGGLATFDQALRGRYATFVVVSEAETLDGVPVLHLRSEAGQSLPQADVAPGTTDLWIAKDGGHLLRMDFDGQGARSSLVISHIDDPASEPFDSFAPPSPVLGG